MGFILDEPHFQTQTSLLYPATLEALAHLLDVHHLGIVIARSRRTDSRGVTEFDFTTNTIHRSWSITDLAIETAETNQNGLYTHVNCPGEMVHEAKSPTAGLVPVG
ncbi:hypothetical protein [Rhodococcus erythropolis]|uniref:hypothetical protein n=1 Tax=Rhodococcus erythropolis TaxID=1833 RepID=UPI00366F31AB